MNYRTYLTFVLSIAFLTSFLVVPALNYLVDPLAVFRRTNSKCLNLYPRRYKNGGYLRVFDGESILVGTSMLNGIDERGFTSPPLKLNMAGSSMKEQSLLIKYALKKQRISKVVWELNIDSLSFPSDYLPPITIFPYWSYSDEHFIKKYLYYLTSFDTLKRSRKCIKIKPLTTTKFKDKNKPTGDESFLDPKTVALFTSREKSRGKDIPPHAPKHLLVSFRENVLNLISQHPKTEFVLFFSPQFIAYLKRYEVIWLDGASKLLNLKEYAYEKLLKVSNASLFDFQTDKEIVCNLKNYIDPVHHNISTGNQIINAINAKNGRISEENYSEKLKTFQKLLRSESFHNNCNI